ncbi:MAG: 2Fe-2S iron-sulfur cluster binding domain-containing protein [Myxococcales bacterium]|nr:2Fe-2S iron-sulfur cluster binding domain-containing protein [Myxococcales bacterium]
MLVPIDLAEALRMLAQHPDACAVAGGTLALNPTQPMRPATLIDLGAIGHDGIEWSVAGELSLGGLVRIGDLAHAPELRQPAWGALIEAVDAMEPRVVRAVATLGGNLCSGGTFVGPLALLGARVEVQSRAGARWAEADAVALQPGELITRVVVPAPVRFARTHAAVLRRTPVGPALVGVALGERGGHCDIVVTGGNVRALRIGGARAGADLARSVAAAVLAAAPDGGLSGDGPWRSAVAGVLARRLAGMAQPRADAPARPDGRRHGPMWRPAAVDGPFWFRADVDDASLAVEVPAHATLTEALRAAGATQVKSGCGEGACGACAVLVDGCLVRSCLTLASRCGGSRIRTAAAPEHAGLATAIAAAGGLQCGYCTPGIVVALGSLACTAPRPLDAAAVAAELDGNLCRCTGYQQLVAAAAEALGREVPK